MDEDFLQAQAMVWKREPRVCGWKGGEQANTETTLMAFLMLRLFLLVDLEQLWCKRAEGI